MPTRSTSKAASAITCGPRARFAPTWPAHVGLRFLQATNATFRVVEVGLTLANQPYFEGSTLFIFGGDAGVSYDMSSTTALGIELGLRHQGKPGAAPLFADPKLQGVNDTGGRWSLPISAFATVRF